MPVETVQLPYWPSSAAGTRVTTWQIDAVVRAIEKCPIIDNHAHPLLKPEALAKHPLLSITTEASGDAIHAALTSLSHLRGVKQLARVLDCAQTWEAVVAAIEQRRIVDYEDWIRECFCGIETILVDDGLDNVDDVYDYEWHNSFTRSACKRIVRIEAVAGRIVHKHAVYFKDDQDSDVVFERVLEEFDAAIRDAIADPEVVGFKSVICYRTGLDVAAVADLTLARASLKDIVMNYASSTETARIDHPGLNDLVLHRAATLVSEVPGHQKKPMQFHTGLGDNDITLAKSSPAHLQGFIRAYPTVPIVLLHASYPFTRELGYLATVYANVYADVGEIFPFVSQDGQEAAIRQILELCPWSKIIWSTDGHWFPETYYLAILQIKEVLTSVLCDYVRKGVLSWKGAIELASDVLFSNSNKLYHLGLDCDLSWLIPLEWEVENKERTDAHQMSRDAETFHRFLINKERPDFVRVCWTDFTAMSRMRMIPFRKLMRTRDEGYDIGITKACLGILQNDMLVPGFSASGEYRLHPDFSSLKIGPIPGHFSMQGDFREQDGSAVLLCPRTQLSRAQELGATEGLSFLVGFEIEFLLLQRNESGGYQPLTKDGHSWSVSRFFSDPKIPKLLADIVKALDKMGIYVEQVHAESAPGQFELVLPPLPPVEAVDTLLHTREVISGMATEAGYKFTLHPKPYPDACGTAAHAHISISSDAGDRKDVYEPFYAGILKHLRAIAAFTYSNPASYERVLDGVWAGGRWVTWGTQNRETPLRKVKGSHWELKCLDGLANPYLALAAVLLAGTNGFKAKEELIWRDCEADPACLTEDDRKGLNVTEMLPDNVESALLALRQDAHMVELLGPELVEKYAAVKEFELKFISNMGKEERRRWLIARY